MPDLKTLDELAAGLPHLLGFHPGDDTVVVSMHGPKVLHTAAFPPTAVPARTIADTLTAVRAGCARDTDGQAPITAVVICHGADPADADSWAAAGRHAATVSDLAGAAGYRVFDNLLVHDGQLYDLTDPAARTPLPTHSPWLAAVQLVFPNPAPSRQALTAALTEAPDPDDHLRMLAALADAAQRAADSQPDRWRADAARDAYERLTDVRPLTPAEHGRLIAAYLDEDVQLGLLQRLADASAEAKLTAAGHLRSAFRLAGEPHLRSVTATPLVSAELLLGQAGAAHHVARLARLHSLGAGLMRLAAADPGLRPEDVAAHLRDQPTLDPRRPLPWAHRNTDDRLVDPLTVDPLVDPTPLDDPLHGPGDGRGGGPAPPPPPPPRR